MREQKKLLDSFLPKNEREWDARLFIDSSIKQNVEFHLEILARALCGINEIRFRSYPEPQRHIIYQETDDNTFPKKTINYTIEASVDAHMFFGNNKIELLCQIISFWAGKQSIFPCGGAYFPNSNISTKYSDLSDKKYSENEIQQLQTKIHKITGDGEIMGLFNQLLGVQSK